MNVSPTKSAVIGRYLLFAFCTLLLLGTACKKKGTEPKPKPPVVPNAVVSLHGAWFKGVMGGSSISPSLLFAVYDTAGSRIANQTIHFHLLTGDGTLSDTALITADSSTATLGYTFGGSLGHAVISAVSADSTVDSAIVNVRANVLIPGGGLQGQYIIQGDNFRNVVRLNGHPVSVDEDPSFWINYANYESTSGVVVLIDDANHSHAADSTEAVIGIIVNSVYTGKTLSNVGIGSSVSAVRAAFGTADSIFTDPTPPAAVVMQYDSLGLTFYGNTTDTTIFEIHLFPTTPPVPSQPTLGSRKELAIPHDLSSRRYHLFR